MRPGWTRALAALGALASVAVGEEPAKPPPAPPAAQAPCATPEHRAFDFWLGAWRVETPSGQPAGSSTITSLLGGCGLLEQWEGAGGSRGTSLNAWDAGSKRWRQTWIDASGGVLLLEGGIEEGAMVMRGSSAEDERPVLERISWTPLAGGDVRQRWQQSRDGGETWSDAFVGIYKRR